MPYGLLANFRQIKPFLRTRNFRSLNVLTRAARLTDLVTHPKRHLAVLKIFHEPALKIILQRQPQLPFKYLNPRFLALNFTTSQRAAALAHHYKTILDVLPHNILQKIFTGNFLLWIFPENQGNHAIKLSFSHPTDNEGELTLDYYFNGLSIYMLSFSIVPSEIAGLPGNSAVLVTRVQGTKDMWPSIREATKSLKEISPPFALAAALQGVALAIGVSGMAGIAAENQVCRGQDTRENLVSTYDEFFRSLGAAKNAASFFCASFPLPEKPIQEIQRSHRVRTRLKREFRKSITETAFHALTKAAVAGAPEPAPRLLPDARERSAPRFKARTGRAFGRMYRGLLGALRRPDMPV